jgi:hypothetical protein
MGRVDGEKGNTLTRGDLQETPIKIGNPYSDVRLNRQESAEAIVLAERRQSKEGPNMIVREVHGKLAREAETAENSERELPSGGSVEYAGA